jgi:hypothetical protein
MQRQDSVRTRLVQLHCKCAASGTAPSANFAFPVHNKTLQLMQKAPGATYMFSFLKHRAPGDATDSRISAHSMPQSLPQSLPSNFQSSHFQPSQNNARPRSDLQRELIPVVLKDTLRRNGIPFDWLTCEVITIAKGPDTEEQLHIQLMLMQWRELFMRYAPALEHQLLRGLDRFEPSVDHSKYIISWRFSPQCGCPFGTLPPAVVWLHDEAPEPPQQAPSILDRRHAPRAARPGTPHAGPQRDDGGYERTELSPFR